MNFFLPGGKLENKWREKSVWKKRYEPARAAGETATKLLHYRVGYGATALPGLLQVNSLPGNPVDNAAG